MFTINLAVIFVFGLAISGIILKGTLLAQESRESEDLDEYCRRQKKTFSRLH